MNSEVKEVEILRMEDNPTDAELAIRTLRKGNLANNLVWVEDGAKALDFLFAQGSLTDRNMTVPPTVIRLDLRLPKVDGVEVLRRVKGDLPTGAISVAVLTSSKEDRGVADSYLLGVSSSFSKPLEFDAFAKTVTDLGLYWLLVNHAPAAEK